MKHQLSFTVLIENTAPEMLCFEHGLSFYLEYNEKRYLLDTGSSNLFLENAKRLGIDLSKVDYAVLSHAHYDHSGGFFGFFQKNKTAKVYVQEKAKEACYKGCGEDARYIGIPERLLESYPERFHFLDGDAVIHQGVWCITHKTEHLEDRGRKANMYIRRHDKFVADDFSHEQSLAFDTEKGLVVFNSCSHGGIVNIVKDIKTAFVGKTVYAVIGGFHLKSNLKGHAGITGMSATKEEVLRLGKTLLELGVQHIYTGHCTGEPAFLLLKEVCGNRIHNLTTGLQVEF